MGNASQAFDVRSLLMSFGTKTTWPTIFKQIDQTSNVVMKLSKNIINMQIVVDTPNDNGYLSIYFLVIMQDTINGLIKFLIGRERDSIYINEHKHKNKTMLLDQLNQLLDVFDYEKSNARLTALMNQLENLLQWERSTKKKPEPKKVGKKK